MIRGYVIALLALSLAGCAASRGFVTGLVGGPLAVDEIVHQELEPGKAHSEMKAFVHQATLIIMTGVLWPFAAAYGGASGIYGAYRFQIAESKKP